MFRRERKTKREDVKREDISYLLRRQGNGFALEGPGFYIWDEDPREVVRVASELRSGNHAPRPCGRMLVVPPGEADPLR